MPALDLPLVLEQLKKLRQVGGAVDTVGLSDDIVERFAALDSRLPEAIQEAHQILECLSQEFPELIDLDESEQASQIQQRYVNFYPDDAVCPYVPLAARGPWIVTSKGRVVHDSGGYGMLGFGHVPEEVLSAMSRPHVMANVMTPSFSHRRLIRALEQELGHTRGECPFADFLCLNSGSESVTVAARLSDVNARQMTDPGGRHEGKPTRVLSLRGGFHGRTDRPAQFSDSSRPTYEKYLATFRDLKPLLTVVPNDVAGLRAIFEQAEKDGHFIEAFFMEPVMGEGDPGQAISREFYDVARELTLAHGSILLVDSIQASIRAHGCLSIVDYPGFQDAAAPDLETYSKALNAGQYPLSVLAMTQRASELYRKGIYGNTMTTNPRALDVACSVMDAVTPELRSNIRDRGQEFLEKLGALQLELGEGVITKVQGTGLLFSVELSSQYLCYGAGSTEEYLRKHGVNVIHGGVNSLRYTPYFGITTEEVDMIVEATRDALENGPRR